MSWPSSSDSWRTPSILRVPDPARQFVVEFVVASNELFPLLLVRFLQHQAWMPCPVSSWGRKTWLPIPTPYCQLAVCSPPSLGRLRRGLWLRWRTSLAPVCVLWISCLSLSLLDQMSCNGPTALDFPATWLFSTQRKSCSRGFGWQFWRRTPRSLLMPALSAISINPCNMPPPGSCNHYPYLIFPGLTSPGLCCWSTPIQWTHHHPDSG